MKKFIATVLLVGASGAAALFADVSASVVMTGNAWGTNGFTLNNEDQKDGDAVEFKVENERAGASFRLWSNLDESNPVKLRKAKLWFKPVETLKISVGNADKELYTEELDWWKIPTGTSYANFLAWDGKWDAAILAQDGPAGVTVEYDPIPGLYLAAALAPGYGKTFWNKDGFDDANGDNANYGFSAKYDVEAFGSVGFAFRDDGKEKDKLVRLGADISVVDGFYAYVCGIARVGKEKVTGLSIDNYFKYSLDAFSAKLRAPVTIRLTGDTGDDHYMSYELKLAYEMEAVTPYVDIEQDDGIVFNDDLDVMPTIRAGIEWAYDGGEFDVGLQINTPGKAEGAEMTWAIPFKFRVSF